MLQTINAQATNLAHIINDMLDLARIESGRGLTLKRSPTDIVTLARTVLESFEADGPDAMWAGMSVSQYVSGEKRWRQVWVDDQGSWFAFTGGKQGDQFILQTEPVGATAGRTLRMVFHEIRPDHISWRWERADSGGATWTPLLMIEYRRSGTGRK